VEQADRCKKIVGGLLNFARKSKVNIEEVNIRKLIKNSIAAIVMPAEINLNIEINTDAPVVECDHDQMVQVLSNLIKNAVDAMPCGGSLHITAEDEKSGSEDVVFIITDTGIGISQENLERMFEPFFTTKEDGKGTGLGLPIIYGIVKMHKGNIKVESNNDPKKGPTGTSFYVSLPKYAERN
jgi:signal transduction histidine kinase